MGTSGVLGAVIGFVYQMILMSVNKYMNIGAKFRFGGPCSICGQYNSHFHINIDKGYMKNWRNNYPLNTFQGKTREELMEAIDAIRKEALTQKDEEWKEKLKSIVPEEHHRSDGNVNNQDISWNACRQEILDRIEKL